MAIPQTPSNPITPSSHLRDTLLAPFLQSSFDPAGYLNTTLPTLRIAVHPASKPGNAPEPITLTEISGQTQTLLSTLNAQATRLTNILTQLTDDVLRASSRLAYEVEILRVETSGLNEILEEELKDEIRLFSPDSRSVQDRPSRSTKSDDAAQELDDPSTSDLPTSSTEPPDLSNLKTLVHVRSQLDSVIQLFGQALQFNMPPSLINPQSTTSSFISVSAPPSDPSQLDSERKGQDSIEKLKAEIVESIKTAHGIAQASEKINDLRNLCDLWKGTVEEKARLQVVEALARLVP